jgi:hypothetical protein
MQLCLVDIATGKNSKFKVNEDNLDQNPMIKYILSSSISYKLVFRVIRMSSINFLKPF